jgi:hypothetical protein
MAIVWIPMHPRAHPDMLGYLPTFLLENDPRPAKEQFQERYVFGGWSSFAGFELIANDKLKYPGDPPILPIYRTYLRDEEITMYEHAWVMIRQKDGTWEVSRMD